MSIFLFTYGSLMFPEVMKTLTTKNFQFEDIEVQGFERRLMKGKLYPGLFRNEQRSIKGRLWCDIDERSAKILDMFEDKIYERAVIKVASYKLKTDVEALVYLISNDCISALEDKEWNPAVFEKSHLPTYVKMCERARQIIVSKLDIKSSES